MYVLVHSVFMAVKIFLFEYLPGWTQLDCLLVFVDSEKYSGVSFDVEAEQLDRSGLPAWNDDKLDCL